MDALDQRIAERLRYDAAYTRSGEPAPGTGVCSDVVLAMLSSLGFDLRREITREVARSPSRFGMRRADPSIDHRRARNQAAFMAHSSAFRRVAANRLRPGDIVYWSTRGNGFVDHVGAVGRYRTAPGGGPSIIHHWPGRPVEETGGIRLFQFVAAYRYVG